MFTMAAVAAVSAGLFVAFRTPKPEDLYKNIMQIKKTDQTVHREILKINYSVVAYENKYKTTVHSYDLNTPFLTNYKSNPKSKAKQKRVQEAKALYLDSYRTHEYNQNLNNFKQMLTKELQLQEFEKLAQRARYALAMEKAIGADILQINGVQEIQKFVKKSKKNIIPIADGTESPLPSLKRLGIKDQTSIIKYYVAVHSRLKNQELRNEHFSNSLKAYTELIKETRK